MKSPITGKEMDLIKEEQTIVFRKEEFTTIHHYFLCKDSGERFTTTELDELNIQQVYNQYREKYNIPFPDEIIAVREKYGLSAAKMAEALGFGANVYRNYENGEVPNDSNGKLIRLAQDSRVFYSLVKENRTLDRQTRDKILSSVNDIASAEQHNPFVVELHEHFLGDHNPDEFSGYKKPNFEKLTEMVVYFSEHIKPFKTKLNKLLFYADFVNFRQTCFSISGARYRAIDMGPVPNNFNAIFDIIESNEDVVVSRTMFPDGGTGEQFSNNPKRLFKPELFSLNEIAVLEMVAHTFGGASTKSIVDISHKEKGWKENFENGKQLISYKYGFDLETI